MQPTALAVGQQEKKFTKFRRGERNHTKLANVALAQSA